MAEVIRMPRMSDTMTEGVIVEWHKKLGDPVKAGDLLAEVETDKATMELESYQEGVLLHIGVETGNAVEVNGIIAILGEKGEDVSAILEEAASTAAESKSSEPELAEQTQEMAASTGSAPPPPPSAPANLPTPAPATTSSTRDGRIKASPLAKKLAKENGITLSTLQGSGENGRIVKRDIEAYLESGTPAAQPIVLPSFTGEESFEEVAVSQMRKTIARRLAESKFGAPHFYLKISIEMDRLMEARKAMNEFSPVKISFNDVIIKAAAVALKRHPAVNSSWLGDRIRFNKHVHIGMAVGIDDGLLVPVIRFADGKSLSHIASETKQLIDKARTKNLSLEEMQGNTFSISNLGMMGIEEFTAIINPPDACIMAIGNIRKEAFLQDGELKERNVMKVTLSCDHRVVDGLTGAQFLATFKQLMEDPVRLLV